MINDWNKTTLLIMPMIYGKYNISNSLESLKAYVGIVTAPEHDNKIICVQEDIIFNIFDVPKQYYDDYWYIVSSNYHLVSDEYYNYLVEFWKPLFPFKPPKPDDLFDIFEEVIGMGVS